MLCLQHRLQKPKVVLLIFVSGKVVMTGGKCLEHLQKAFDLMYPVLFHFRKETALMNVAGEPVARDGGPAALRRLDH
jgi:transcription initiation factor TFIID TATA-box-binding protein